MPADDILTLTFTREEAYQLLTLLAILDTAARVHIPAAYASLDIRSEPLAAKVAELQTFVEGTQPQ